MNKKLMELIIPIIILVFILGLGIGYSLQKIEKEYVVVNQTYSKVTINLAAIDNNGNGAIIPLIVEAKPGSGKILTDIDKLLFWVDTQYSIQLAKFVAEDVTHVDASKFDLVYTIQGENLSVVGGPSAGAAITIATIAALENKTIKPDVMITGTINEDETIGEVGAVLEKAEAAKQSGATLFLVPKGEGIETTLEPQEKCTESLGFIYCQTTYKRITTNIGETVGIRVVEVSNIEEALNYFLNA
jgi:uncharacterized protein